MLEQGYFITYSILSEATQMGGPIVLGEFHCITGNQESVVLVNQINTEKLTENYH